MATSAAEATFGLWDMKELTSVHLNEEMEFTARSMSFTGDGELLGVGGEDTSIWIVSRQA